MRYLVVIFAVVAVAFSAPVAEEEIIIQEDVVLSEPEPTPELPSPPQGGVRAPGSNDPIFDDQSQPEPIPELPSPPEGGIRAPGSHDLPFEAQSQPEPKPDVPFAPEGGVRAPEPQDSPLDIQHNSELPPPPQGGIREPGPPHEGHSVAIHVPVGNVPSEEFEKEVEDAFTDLFLIMALFADPEDLDQFLAFIDDDNVEVVIPSEHASTPAADEPHSRSLPMLRAGGISGAARMMPMGETRMGTMSRSGNGMFRQAETRMRPMARSRMSPLAAAVDSPPKAILHAEGSAVFMQFAD